MTLWARLTWQVAEPARFAAQLAGALGVEPPAAGDAPDTFVLDLGSAVLEIRPWIREGPADEPRPGGRLMLEPVPGGEEAPAARADPVPLVLAGIGWATVELDRAEDELDPWLGDPEPDTPPDGRATREDPHLGATARVRGTGGLPAETFVLLEPVTEGRLAASLARDGEGPCAMYLRPRDGLGRWSTAAGGRGVVLSSRRTGPLGASRLVLGGPVAGPHLVIVDGPRLSNGTPVAGTIGA